MTDKLDAIARPSGALAMVAMDQRESLRAMFDAAGAGRPPDEVLVRFKLDVARALGPVASGFLIDRHYGADRVAGLLPPGCGLILAADELTQRPGGPVEETDLDPVALGLPGSRPSTAPVPETDSGPAPAGAGGDPGLAAGAGGMTGAGRAPVADRVAALKLLVIWRRDEHRQRRVRLARSFIDAAAERGLPSVLEPVVRATPGELSAGTWDTDEAIREAARELSALRPTLYKAQVPLGGAGGPADQLAASERLGAAITGPWVVLSQGVPVERFRAAVEAACRGGASGFLAGRALWSDVVGAADVPARLRAVSLPRLEALVDVVDRYARPWWQA